MTNSYLIDTVEYKLYSKDRPLTIEDQAQVNLYAESLSEKYIWHKDPFHLVLSHRKSANSRY